MPMYAYKGIGANGKTVTGVRDADSPKALRQLMRKDGVVVTEFDLSKGGKKIQTSGKGLNRDVNLNDIFGRIKRAEVAAFTRQLATLLRAGIPLAEAMGALFEQAENPKFKSVIGEVRTAVNEGSSMADSLAKHPSIYDDLYVSMVRAGEVAGNLDEVLGRLADFMEASAKLKAKVQAAMQYPIIMAVVGSGILALMMVAVVPQITQIFASQDKALPWNTELLIWATDLIGGYWWLLGTLGGLSVYVFRKWSRSPEGRPKWDRFMLKLPMFGHITRQVAVSRFSRTMSTMLNAGVPMLRALDTSKEILGNVILMDVIETAKQAVSEGESLAVTLRRSGHFPSSMIHMVAVGERSGALEDMLMRVADAYDSEVNTSLERMTARLAPAMLVIMASGIGFVVFSIMGPIMNMGMAF